MMCLFDHKNLKYYTDADQRSLRINERSPHCPGSTYGAYVRSLRIKDNVFISTRTKIKKDTDADLRSLRIK